MVNSILKKEILSKDLHWPEVINQKYPFILSILSYFIEFCILFWYLNYRSGYLLDLYLNPGISPIKFTIRKNKKSDRTYEKRRSNKSGIEALKW